MISILLCTFNGQKYLKAQLDSIATQHYHDWDLWISDDGSTDQTLEICRDFQQRYKGKHNVHILNGPRKGFSKNFLSLIERCDSKSEYFCFADQDDIWLPDKIERAIIKLRGADNEKPLLYCSRCELVNGEGLRYKPPKFSRSHCSKPCFQNALVQSIASGNTMVINVIAKDLLVKTLPKGKIPSHDWWTYIIISGFGGEVIYDRISRILYRQHENNLVGDNSSVFAKLTRLRKFYVGNYRMFNRMNLEALDTCKELLTQSSRETLGEFQKARRGGLLGAYHLYKSKAFRDGFTNFGLWLGCLIKKI